MKEPEYLAAIKSTEMFVLRSQAFIGLMTDYAGGEYCTGLYFGINGGQFLIDLAEG